MTASANAGLAAGHAGFDLVHVHEIGLPAAPLALTRRVPALCVTTLHGGSGLPLGGGRRADAWLHADLVIATTEGIARAASARDAALEPVVIAAGVDLDELAPMVPASPPRIVVERAPTERAPVRALRRALAHAGCEIMTVAPADSARRRRLLPGAAIFVASLSGDAQAAVEAAACGVAAIACDGSPAAEVVEHEVTGLRYPPGQPELTAAVALRLLDDDALRARLGKATRTRAETVSYATVAERLEALYADLLARRRAAPPTGAEPADGERILCDLHMHTHHSHDCATGVDDLLDQALARGLGAIAVTDHNTIAGGLEAARRAAERQLPLHVIVGSELKTDGDGEVIGLFLDAQIPRGLSFAETVARIHGQGGVVYVPHPFDRMHSIPRPQTLRRHVDEIDVLETCNARLYFEADNATAAAFAARYGVPAGAGSDSHVLEGLATGALLMPRFDDAEGFMAALRRSEIVRRPRSLLYLQGLKWYRQRRRA